MKTIKKHPSASGFPINFDFGYIQSKDNGFLIRIVIGSPGPSKPQSGEMMVHDWPQLTVHQLDLGGLVSQVPHEQVWDVPYISAI